MTKKIKIKYPAVMVVHWPTGPVNCCQSHGNALVGLGNMLGSHIAVAVADKEAQCTNCINENPELLVTEPKG